MSEQEEKRTRLLHAIQKRLKADQQQQQQDANTKDVDFEEEHDVIRWLNFMIANKHAALVLYIDEL